MPTSRFRRPSPSRRGRAIAAAAALAVSAVLVPATSGNAQVAASATSAGHASAVSLSPTTFADPPMSVKPMYRWWMPLAYTDDDELRRELRDIASGGAGGVEVSPFVV